MKKKFTTILRAGLYYIGAREYRFHAEEEHKLSNDEVLHFERWGMVLWSDHPRVQLRLALGEWKKKRQEVIDAGRSLANFLKSNRVPKLSDAKKVPVPKPI